MSHLKIKDSGDERKEGLGDFYRGENY